jgi:cysteine desulfuration protein SufE
MSASPSPLLAARAQAIRDAFAVLDDWEYRYAHLIDLGRQLPPLAEHERVEENRVRGCASRVWLVAEPGAEPGTLSLRAQSDAVLVSGLAALLTGLLSGVPARDVLAFDIRALLDEIGVAEALTSQRANGLASMLERIRVLASTLGDIEEPHERSAAGNAVS